MQVGKSEQNNRGIRGLGIENAVEDGTNQERGDGFEKADTNHHHDSPRKTEPVRFDMLQKPPQVRHSRSFSFLVQSPGQYGLPGDEGLNSGNCYPISHGRKESSLAEPATLVDVNRR
jgi:hypothetical protein